MVEEFQPSKKFVSTLIPQSETVIWEIHNVSQLLKNDCWSALSIPMEVGWGPVGLSKWEISLHSNGKMVQARAKLLAPSEGQKVTHLLSFKVQRRGKLSLLKHSDSHKAKETSFSWHSTFWKILPLEDLLDPDTGIVDEDDSFQLSLTLTVFGADLSHSDV